MWIGMSYTGLENGWKWEDASEVSFTQWDQGEPNNWENGYVSSDCYGFFEI